ncbi:MAG: GNAT family N-acetyltransferase [Lachnospiraceae bacterium]
MLRLRPYKKCDAEAIVKWHKDEESFRKWALDKYENYPITADDMNCYYDSFAYSDTLFPFTAFDEEGVCGHMIMRFLDSEKQSLRFGFIIVDTNRRGKGYGREMLVAALKYAFEVLKVDKVSLGVFENNPGARKCYEKVGLKPIGYEEGSYVYHGERWNIIDMGITKKEYEAFYNVAEE